jgi:hypothetical protein
MRKEFTAVSAFSAIIAFTAGIVLCMQVSHTEPPAGLEIARPVFWMVEIAVFGTAVFAWRTRATFIGWAIGIAAMEVMRVALASGASLILAIVAETTNMAPALRETSQMMPRMCAAGFALMVCYPFRILLPLRDHQRRRRAFKDSPAAKDPELELVIVTARERAANAGAAPKAEVKFQTAPGILSSVPMFDGEIELSLSTMLALMPENLVTDRALALSDGGTMAIPLEAVLPQLKEAQIVFSVSELREWIPLTVRKVLLQPAESDIETENGLVSAPLNLIVPQVPAEALQLPPPSPPAWAKIDSEEHVVFATV